jgi:hypothetical protein
LLVEICELLFEKRPGGFLGQHKEWILWIKLVNQVSKKKENCPVFGGRLWASYHPPGQVRYDRVFTVNIHFLVEDDTLENDVLLLNQFLRVSQGQGISGQDQQT